MVQFPGAYSDTDEYANFSIYNGFKEFPMPGPAVWSSGASSTPSEPSSPETSETPEAPETEVPETETPETEAPEASCAGMWEQCGGSVHTGATCCSAGTCQVINEWYSQCA